MQACQLPGTGAIALPSGMGSEPLYYVADAAVPGGWRLVVGGDPVRYKGSVALSAYREPTRQTTSGVTPTLANFTLTMGAGGNTSRAFTLIVSHEGYVGYPVKAGEGWRIQTTVTLGGSFSSAESTYVLQSNADRQGLTATIFQAYMQGAFGFGVVVPPNGTATAAVTTILECPDFYDSSEPLRDFSGGCAIRGTAID